jgi:hypothetical protein
MIPTIREDQDALRLILETLEKCLNPEPSEQLSAQDAENAAAENCAAFASKVMHRTAHLQLPTATGVD